MLQILRLIPAVAILVTSCVLSSMPTIEAMPSFWNADKLVHIVCFGGLAFWVAFGLCRPVCSWRKRLNGFWLWIVPLAFVAVYGVVDEFHQSFTPGRSCSALDWGADVVGATLGSAAHMALVLGNCAFSRVWRRLAGVAEFECGEK